jgi:hypothetical protein
MLQLLKPCKLDSDRVPELAVLKGLVHFTQIVPGAGIMRIRLQDWQINVCLGFFVIVFHQFPHIVNSDLSGISYVASVILKLVLLFSEPCRRSICSGPDSFHTFQRFTRGPVWPCWSPLLSISPDTKRLPTFIRKNQNIVPGF